MVNPVAEALMTPFMWGRGGARLTPEQIAREREIAEAMGVVDTSPVDHWLQGAARMANAAVGKIKEGRASKAEAQNATAKQGIIAGLLGGMGGGAGAFPAAPSDGNPTVSDYADTRVKMAAGEGADAIRQGLVARGMQPHVADAFVMNFQDESGLNPGINEANPIVPGSRGGFGLAQWTGPRRKALEAFAAERGVPVADTDAQLDFLMSELQGPEARAWQAIQSAPDAGGAAAAIVNNFLRPAEQHRASREARYLQAGGPSQTVLESLAVGESTPPQAPVQVAQASMPRNEMSGMVDVPVSGGGINPAIIEALSSPYVDDQTRNIAGMLLQQNMQAQQQANDPMRALDMDYKRAQIEKMQREAANPGGDETFFGNPVAIQGADGSVSYGQMGNRGTFRPIQLPEGQTFAPPTRTINTGTENILVDQAGNVISRVPIENRRAAAETAGGTVEGRTAAERAAAAPSDIQAGHNALDLLDQIEKHPGMDYGTGAWSYGNVIPGTSGYDFQNIVEQAKSGAFLSAIQQMRGMGSLSNAEGAAATAAVTRMDTATSKDAFLAALRDYRKIVQQGIDRARGDTPSEDAAPAKPLTDMTDEELEAIINGQ